MAALLCVMYFCETKLVPAACGRSEFFHCILEQSHECDSPIASDCSAKLFSCAIRGLHLFFFLAGIPTPARTFFQTCERFALATWITSAWSKRLDGLQKTKNGMNRKGIFVIRICTWMSDCSADDPFCCAGCWVE